MSSRRALPAIGLVGLTACGGGGPTTAPVAAVPALSLAVVSGDSQFGPPERLLGEFLVLRVTDRAGLPVVGLPVAWEVASGGGKVSGKRHDTDMEGLAAGNFTLGTALGEHVARALVAESLAVEFTAFAVTIPEDEPRR